MASFNKVILMGNLTRDPEVKYTQGGTAVCSASIATNRVWTDSNGQKQEEVTYVEITFWGKQAEIVGQYMKKGSPMHVEGRLKLDEWEDRDTGKKRSKLSVVAESMQMLGSRRDSEGGEQQQSRGSSGGGGYRGNGGGYRSAAAQRPQAQQQDDDGPITDGMEDDDIPF